MNIKPIKTKKDHLEALKEVEKLWDAKPRTSRGDKLEVLTTLIEAYEKQNYPIYPPDPIEAIKFRMEHQGLKRSELGPILGGRNRATEILQRRRKPTVNMLRKLHKELNIPAESLLS